MNNWDEIQYFKPYEFASPDVKGSGKFMNINFVKDLDYIRSEIGVPLIVESGVRSVKHNKKVGGVYNSSHLINRVGGVVAVDLVCRDNGLRDDIIFLAHQIGIRRIGIGRSFIHLDKDDFKMQKRMWHYYPKRSGMSAMIFGAGNNGEDR